MSSTGKANKHTMMINTIMAWAQVGNTYFDLWLLDPYWYLITQDLDLFIQWLAISAKGT